MADRCAVCFGFFVGSVSDIGMGKMSFTYDWKSMYVTAAVVAASHVYNLFMFFLYHMMVSFRVCVQRNPPSFDK